MAKFLLIISTIFLLPLWGSVRSIEERLLSAKSGDYIVLEQSKLFSLLLIADLSEGHLILEEINVPASQKKKSESWSQYYKKGAPGASSHLLHEINLKEHKLIRSYSLTKRTFLAADPFLTQLFAMPLSPIAREDRKRIGPPSLTESLDTRKIWNPPVVIEGKRIKKRECLAYQTRWPKDETLLSRKFINLYFDKFRPDFPFPCWMEVSDGSNTLKMRCVDTGSNLSPLPHHFPMTLPAFLPNFGRDTGGLVLTLSRDLPPAKTYLFASDLSSQPKRTLPIPFKAEGDQLKISHDNIMRLLSKEHRYRFFLILEGHPEMMIDHPRIFLFR